MKFSYRYTPFIFIVLLLGLTFGLLALVHVQPRSVVTLPDSTLLTAQYQATLRSIVGQYRATIAVTPLSNDLTAGQRADWHAAASAWRDQLLGLAVPGPYRDFHLQLVLQFDSLVKVMSTDGAKADEVAQKIQALIDSATWLAVAPTKK